MVDQHRSNPEACFLRSTGAGVSGIFRRAMFHSALAYQRDPAKKLVETFTPACFRPLAYDAGFLWKKLSKSSPPLPAALGAGV